MRAEGAVGEFGTDRALEGVEVGADPLGAVGLRDLRPESATVELVGSVVEGLIGLGGAGLRFDLAVEVVGGVAGGAVGGGGLDDFSGARVEQDELGAGLGLAVTVGVGGLGSGEAGTGSASAAGSALSEGGGDGGEEEAGFSVADPVGGGLGTPGEAFAEDGGVGGGLAVDGFDPAEFVVGVGDGGAVEFALVKDAVQAMAGDGVAGGVVVVSPRVGSPVHRVWSRFVAEKQVGGEVAGFQVEEILTRVVIGDGEDASGGRQRAEVAKALPGGDAQTTGG